MRHHAATWAVAPTWEREERTLTSTRDLLAVL